MNFYKNFLKLLLFFKRYLNKTLFYIRNKSLEYDYKINKNITKPEKLNTKLKSYLSIPNYASETMDYINSKLIEGDSSKLITIREFAKNNKHLNWSMGKPDVVKLGTIGDLSNYEYSIESLLNISDFNNNVNSLKKIFDNFNELNSYSIAFLLRNPRVNTIITLGGHYLVNKTTDCKDLLNQAYSQIDELSVRYKILFSDYITVKIRPMKFKVKDPVFKGGRIRNTKSLPSDVDLNINYKLLSKKLIPHTMDLYYYGHLVSKLDNVLWFEYNNVFIKVVIIKENYNHMIEVYNKKLKIIAKLEDIVFEDSFIREFYASENNKENVVLQYDLDYNLINLEFYINVKFMDRIPKDLKHVNKFLTFDIETYLDNENNSVPYACGFYDGTEKKLYYLDKSIFENSEAMLRKCIEDMLSPKYHNYCVYCHNFSNFDAIFLHRLLHKYFKVSNIVSKDVSIISMSISKHCETKKSIVKLKFVDSFGLLPSSLQRLAISFEVNTTKGHFPYSFVNKDNLDYSGDIPDFTYYKSLSIEQYNQIKEITTV